jgi:hypothetical protein
MGDESSKKGATTICRYICRPVVDARQDETMVGLEFILTKTHGFGFFDDESSRAVSRDFGFETRRTSNPSDSHIFSIRA